MPNEFKLEYTKIDTDRCTGVTLKNSEMVCHGWSLKFDEEGQEQIICDMAKCPLLTKVALGEVIND